MFLQARAFGNLKNREFPFSSVGRALDFGVGDPGLIPGEVSCSFQLLHLQFLRFLKTGTTVVLVCLHKILLSVFYCKVTPSHEFENQMSMNFDVCWKECQFFGCL